MATLQVTTQGTLPEKLFQGMFLPDDRLPLAPEFQGEFLLEG
jgi:hypothetical protein